MTSNFKKTKINLYETKQLKLRKLQEIRTKPIIYQK